ncbi:glycosyltransferase [Nakamurella lactea]|uniref:glycosyltransferase n=1 Tax=Nakamurella lactea TaxID=459515 RepID=UPI00041352BC|nr:glycosyltransferase [Nakamurella lactea]
MTSVVIAAHNESAVIGRCLDALLADAAPGELDVTVVANGCTDATASVAAARPGVRVVDTAEAGKAKALNLGDAVAVGYPRIYLDADITASTFVVRTLVEALDRGARPPAGGIPVLAVVPRRELDVRGRPLLVRGYFAINKRLPAFRSGLFGRGVIALSEAGRRRFDTFPEMVADDLFLDSLFDAAEKQEATAVATVVAAPLRTRDLVRRLVRVRRGNAAMRAAGRSGEVAVDVRHADRWAWLREVVLPQPWLAPAAVVYVGITALAAVLARRSSSNGDSWGRDESTRTKAEAMNDGEDSDG